MYSSRSLQICPLINQGPSLISKLVLRAESPERVSSLYSDKKARVQLSLQDSVTTHTSRYNPASQCASGGFRATRHITH